MEKQTALMVRNLELESLPGWVSLDGDDQLALRRETGAILEARTEQGFGALREAQHLTNAKAIYDKAGLPFKAFVERMYGASIRTAYKRLEDYAELQKRLPERVIAILASQGLAMTGQYSMGIKEFLSVRKSLPMPSAKADNATVVNYVRQVAERFRSNRIKARRGQITLEYELARAEGYVT